MLPGRIRNELAGPRQARDIGPEGSPLDDLTARGALRWLPVICCRAAWPARDRLCAVENGDPVGVGSC